MASWDDVRSIALSLPQTAETTSRGLLSWRVKDRGFVWERPLRTRELAERAPPGPILGARTEHLAAKEALIATAPEIYFTTAHFDGFTAVLVRLTEIPPDELRELVVEAWLSRAPPRLAREYAGAHLLGPPP